MAASALDVTERCVCVSEDRPSTRGATATDLGWRSAGSAAVLGTRQDLREILVGIDGSELLSLKAYRFLLLGQRCR